MSFISRSPQSFLSVAGLTSWRQDEASNANYNPLRMWILQLVLIMVLTQLLSQLMKKVRQPRVIAEVFAGILLSPSALGRIPNFTNYFFPEISKPYLFLIADIGLVLFLFLVGLEIEGAAVRKTASLSASIALGGIILPFGLGSALAVPLYNYFGDPSVEFTHFFLFIGIAFSITAFPVLCRILTELKLLDTTVGVVVLSAGVLNDIFGWILLALSLTLARSTSNLAALWILSYCVAWVLFILFPMGRAFSWLAHWTDSINNGPSVLFIAVAMFTMFCSAFFTDLIGVHAIFGAFLVGLIIPREGGLAIALVEKFKDIVSIVFLPLYFTASGLSTDFGLLNDRLTWTFTLGIIILAWVGKFGGGLLAARIAGLKLREAAVIGTLLSCKGLIELIVLNVGLSVGILNKRVFSMFVLEALTLTFLTTPVVVALYPPENRKKSLLVRPSIYHDVERVPVSTNVRWKSHVIAVLDRIDQLSGIMNFMELLNHGATLRSNGNNPGQRPGSRSSQAKNLSVKALRLIELSERSSGGMKPSAIDRLLTTDPLLKTFKTYCRISGIDVSALLSIVPLEEFASKVAEGTNGHSSELLLIPWSGAHLDNGGGEISLPNKSTKGMENPTPHVTLSDSRFHFLRDVFSKCKTDLVLLMDRGVFFNESQNGHHFIFPFFGGTHDRLALRLVLQLCAKDSATATVIRIHTARPYPTHEQTSTKTATMIDDEHRSSQIFLETEQKADEGLWREFTNDTSVCTDMQETLGRIEFLEKEKPTTLTKVLHRIHLEIEKAIVDRSKRPFIILSRGNNNTFDGGSEGYEHEHDTNVNITPDIISTLGALPSAVLAGTDDRIGLMIVQSKLGPGES